MSLPPRDSALNLTLLGAGDSALACPPSIATAEEEVVVLFDQFRDRLLRYVLSIGVYGHDAEDVIQDVFLSLFRHLQLGRSRRNLRGWLFRVAHNLALKQRNRRHRQERRTESDSDTAESKRDPARSPEERLAETQRQRQLLAVLAALPERDRWCLRLRLEGLRYREIAKVLGISLGSVASSVARTIARLARVDGR